jgi:signal transduction histidine kinase
MSLSQNDTAKADILIVDDTPNNLRLLTQILAEQNYKVRAVLNGERALRAVASDPPDVILLDIMMPVMNGYEVCKHLQADEATRDIPIIFISALDATEDKVRALEVGGVDYVTKPFQVEEVVARVETHLAMRNLQRQLREANQELAQRLEEVDRLNIELQMRNEELAAYDHSVSHDLKNPIGGILMSADWLEGMYDKLPAEDVEMILASIARNAHKANNIIESLLLLSEPGPVACEPLDMLDVVAAAYENLTPMVEEYEAEVVLPTALPPALGHPALVERVWDNYISNAIKYGGEPPHVTLGGEVLPDGMVRYWVCDDGEGLTPDDQMQLFTAFKRLPGGNVEGHGLGLSIARRVVEKMGGEVGVESEAGKGSNFYFTLPGLEA